MIFNVYACYDSAVGAYGRPFVLLSDGQAKRNILDAALHEGTEINQHPEDFVLFSIGGYDDSNAQLIPHELGPQRLCGVLELVAEYNNNRNKSLAIGPALPDGLPDNLTESCNDA